MRLPRVFRTATFQLTFAQVGLFGLCTLILFAVVMTSAASFARRQLESAVAAEAAALAGEDDPSGREELIASIEARTRDRRAEGHWYRLQSPGGAVLAGGLPQFPPQPEWQTVSVPGGKVIPPDDEPHRVLVQVRRLANGDLLLVGREMQDEADLTEVLEQAFGFASAITLLLAIATGYVVSRGFLRRIESVNETARTIMDGGDLALRIRSRGNQDEFDRLAINLNAMLARVETLIEGVRQVSCDIAHDLRTPLTHLRQRLELARIGAATLSDYEAVVESAVADTDGLLRTFAALLRIAQVEAGTRRAGFAPVDLSEICETIVETYAAVAEDSGRRVSASVTPGVLVTGDRELLTQMLANLTENAIRHTPVGTIITATLTSELGRPLLIVADTGPGIDPGLREKVFGRFVKGRGQTDGSGLGLSLVRAVAELHGAAITLEDNKPGVRAIVAFPPPSTNTTRREFAGS